MSKVRWLDKNAMRWLDKSLVRAPVWAIKTGFSCDEERVRFTESLAEGVTALHVAECAEEHGTYEVVDGVHRFEVISAMSDVQSILVIDHGKCTLLERKALAVRYAWNFTKDAQAFGEVLKELNAELPDFSEWAPVDADEVNRMIAELNTDLDIFADSLDNMQPRERKPTQRKQQQTTGTKKVRIVCCPGCGEQFTV